MTPTPNSTTPQDLIPTFRRIVHLSVETERIVGQLPVTGFEG